MGYVQAVSKVSFHLDAGETLGLVGESGCGKSTTGRAVLQLHKPTAGSVRYNGRELTTLSPREMRPVRRDLQIVFQDPYASLNPKMPVNDIVGEPLRVHGMKGEMVLDRVAELLERVGLNPEHGNRYPHEFSGGQLQRVAIARALMPSPSVLIADEPVSALDVSIRAQVLNLLKDLVAELGLTLVLIAHDLSVVAYTTSRVAVMAAGRIVEVGRPLDLFGAPRTEPTRALVGAVLTVEGGLAGTALRG